jgi:outer membrane protein assembly factor BamA
MAYAVPFGRIRFDTFDRIRFDTFDRTVFPRRGLSVLLKSESVYGIGKDLSFSRRYVRHSFDGKAYFPIQPRFSLLSRAEVGHTNSSEVFLSHQFFLGGGDSFPGLNPHEMSGTQLLAFQLGVQYEVMSGKFMILRGNIGKTSNSLRVLMEKQNFMTGIGMTLGAATRLGPIELTVMHSDRHDWQMYLNLGYRF